MRAVFRAGLALVALRLASACADEAEPGSERSSPSASSSRVDDQEEGASSPAGRDDRTIPPAPAVVTDDGTARRDGGPDAASDASVDVRDAAADARDAAIDARSDAGTPAGTPDSGTGPAAFVSRCLGDINAYRASRGIAALTLDAQLSAFATAGSMQLSIDHLAHQHFIDAANGGTLFQSGFSGSAAENQGPTTGYPVLSADPVQNEMMQIDAIEAAMFAEGPGDGVAHGHYTNMMNPTYRRVGIGLVMVSQRLYLTNDFSP